jgi:acyl dehydratase
MSKLLENTVFEKIRIGDSAELKRTLTKKDIQLFAHVSGDVNPAHLDVEYAEQGIFHKVVAHGMWTASLISTVLGTEFPGPGTIYLSQSLKFQRPVAIGDEILVRVTVVKKFVRKPIIILACKCTNQKEAVVLTGYAKVLAPTVAVKRKAIKLPNIKIED